MFLLFPPQARASVSASLCDDDCLVGARWELAKRTERAILTMDDDEGLILIIDLVI